MSPVSSDSVLLCDIPRMCESCCICVVLECYLDDNFTKFVRAAARCILGRCADAATMTFPLWMTQIISHSRCISLQWQFSDPEMTLMTSKDGQETSDGGRVGSKKDFGSRDDRFWTSCSLDLSVHNYVTQSVLNL